MKCHNNQIGTAWTNNLREWTRFSGVLIQAEIENVTCQG